MRYIALVLATILSTPALALDATTLAACEKDYKKHVAEAKAAAPAGFKPDRPRGYRVDYVAKCLNK